LIATDLMLKAKWKDAEPHALAAAGTHSAWGLHLAAQVYEGLGDWDESERWLRTLAEAYPTSSGVEWYLWCRRTGRGQVAEAKTYYDEFLKLDSLKNSPAGISYLFIDDVLNDRIESAIRRIDSMPELEENFDFRMRVAVLTALLGKKGDYAESITGIYRDASERRATRPVIPVLKFFYDARDKDNIGTEEITAVKGELERLDPEIRSNYSYLIGELLLSKEQIEQAEPFWRDAVTRGPFNRMNVTFAGRRLADLHGKSRPD
jgi:tetratricopeptide (TPR) repeat protein